MTNKEALKSLCTAICSAFYPDSNVLDLALLNAGIIAEQIAQPKDVAILKTAVSLVKGFVETSRSEGGISVGIDQAKIDKSIKVWCAAYGADEAEIMGDAVSSIEDGSILW